MAKISKKKRQEVWTKYNGNNMKFKCFCCNDIELNGLGSWECGHIISEINGGNLSIENLENNSMDFYASVRSLYLQDRQKKISNSKEVTETMDDSDWEEIETN